eukprot:TRINITY_DN8252_c0_g1_i2.p1 TRINITY_DN8252_c0_g1~~TRINITY_DN8252_c0_g1_i2.p1  ORF type:complete len:390 (+),score=132.17 TRINITY_DN8252_c0_g1_i2:78-1247(+)
MSDEEEAVLRKLLVLFERADEADNSSKEAAEAELEDACCFLWDVSCRTEMADFLVAKNVASPLLSILLSRHTDRLVEVALGLLANIVSTCSAQSAAAVFAGNTQLPSVVCAVLLTDADPPTLTETTRLLTACVQVDELRPQLLRAINQRLVLETLLFIVDNSLHQPLVVEATRLLASLVFFDATGTGNLLLEMGLLDRALSLLDRHTSPDSTESNPAVVRNALSVLEYVHAALDTGDAAACGGFAERAATGVADAALRTVGEPALEEAHAAAVALLASLLTACVPLATAQARQVFCKAGIVQMLVRDVVEPEADEACDAADAAWALLEALAAVASPAQLREAVAHARALAAAAHGDAAVRATSALVAACEAARMDAADFALLRAVKPAV